MAMGSFWRAFWRANQLQHHTGEKGKIGVIERRSLDCSMRNENKVIDLGEIYQSERVQITQGKNKNGLEDTVHSKAIAMRPLDEQADHKPLFAPSTAIA